MLHVHLVGVVVRLNVDDVVHAQSAPVGRVHLRVVPLLRRQQHAVRANARAARLHAEHLRQRVLHAVQIAARAAVRVDAAGLGGVPPDQVGNHGRRLHFRLLHVPRVLALNDVRAEDVRQRRRNDGRLVGRWDHVGHSERVAPVRHAVEQLHAVLHHVVKRHGVLLHARLRHVRVVGDGRVVANVRRPVARRLERVEQAHRLAHLDGKLVQMRREVGREAVLHRRTDAQPLRRLAPGAPVLAEQALQLSLRLAHFHVVGGHCVRRLVRLSRGAELENGAAGGQLPHVVATGAVLYAGSGRWRVGQTCASLSGALLPGAD
ncbi:glutamate decarboxylase [Gracilaria domingensis]|nr:glutamate decarboxylase [Gracilaria domingensis]